MQRPGLEWFDVTKDAGSTAILCSRSSAGRESQVLYPSGAAEEMRMVGFCFVRGAFEFCVLFGTNRLGGFSPLVGTSCGFFGM